MVVVVMAAIITMSIVLGAELGPKADPTTTTYTPRPGVVLLLPLRAAAGHQAAGAGAARDDRHPDDLHDPAVPAAVLRPRPGAAAGAAPDRDGRGPVRDRGDGLPDVPRRRRGPADPDRHADAGARSPRRAEGRSRSTRSGKLVVGQSGCLACHKIGENGNAGPGPPLTEIAARLPAAGDRADAREPDRADAVVRQPAADPARQVQRDGRVPRAAQGRPVARPGGR